MTTELEGLALVRAAIELVRANGFEAVFAALTMSSPEPAPIAPELLDKIRLDGGLPLSPCLKEWLAFDGSLFGWFDQRGAVNGERLAEMTSERFQGGDMFEAFQPALPRSCYALPFNDSEYLHFIYPSKPDSTGELPVLSAELENQQVLVTYPGIDMFLGYHAGLLERDWHARVRPRFTEHHQQTFGGKPGLVLGEDVVPEPPPSEDNLPPNITKSDKTTYIMRGDGPVPDGFRVTREGRDPFTKKPLRFLRRN